MSTVSLPPTYQGPAPGSPEHVRAVIAELRRLYPDAKCTLNFENPLQLLIAVQLSAQCTDERVNEVTAQLFRKYRTVEDFANADPEELEQDIKPTGFYRNKARNLRLTCQRLITDYGGEVPRSMEALLTLPGVARKTANVVLGNAFGIVEGFVVDTHVKRLARRLGWTQSEDPEQIERDLMRIVPREDWLDLSHLLIFHGRALCRARDPRCEECPLVPLCPSAFQANGETTAAKKRSRRTAARQPS
uniref:Endonuclease III n=1 Tax=Thermogemmatispora argillosa TaxID=2045280 RepID=A0A455T8M1_9CHLR|nr:endonuclease III [Thermogemmatispora argillosa]